MLYLTSYFTLKTQKQEPYHGPILHAGFFLYASALSDSRAETYLAELGNDTGHTWNQVSKLNSSDLLATSQVL